MKNVLKNLLDAMGFAWSELFDLPLQNIFRNSSSGNGESSFTLAAFPLLGFLIGVLVALISSLVALIFNPHAGGVLFALISWAVLCFKDSGRGDAWLGNYVVAKLQLDGNREFVRNIMNIFPVLLKFAILLFIGLAGGTFYLAILLAGAFALQAALVSSEDCQIRFIPSDDRSIVIFRVVLGIIGVAGFIFCRLGTIGAIAAGCVLFIIYNRKFAAEGFSAEAVSRAGYVAEWTLLGIGLCLL